MFEDTTVDGVTTTKAEHEAAYQTEVDADAAKAIRLTRNNLLSSSDWRGLPDITMSSDWATYRQALRDVPSQSGFPHDITWPEKPE